jgi:3-hydroxy-9,10-secoandrosta-1,3,5(10)-triene-9,17-dione monooxygenase reductase component
MEIIDSQRFRSVLACYPTGVCIVTSLEPSGAPTGMAVGSFTSVSLDPPLVAFLPERRSTTWAHIKGAGRFCVNVLSERQAALSRVFGSRVPNKFDSVDYRLSPSGMPLLEGAVAWIDCELDAVHAAGDHDIVIGRVSTLQVESADPPLLFHRGTYGQPVSLMTL